MNKHFSIYLDLVRFLAAVLVLIDHLVSHGFFSDPVSKLIPQLGREAVIVFFVLSGYVIAFTTNERSPNWREYFIARTSRIYSVALPILLLAFTAYFIYSLISPDSVSNYQLEKAYIYIPFHLLFLGELWTLSEVPPWLGAYWSLSYEVWYYILFGTFFYTSGKIRTISVTLVALVMGYKLWLLAPIWFSGVALYYVVQKSERLPKKQDTIYLIGSVFTLIFYKLFDIDIYLRQLGKDIWWFDSLSLGSAERYLADYLVTVIILVNFYYASKAALNFSDRAGNLIRNFASYTFTLYLLHVVTISVWITYFEIEKDSIFQLVGVLFFTYIATYIVGGLTEHKKSVFAKPISYSLNKLSGKKAQT